MSFVHCMAIAIAAISIGAAAQEKTHETDPANPAGNASSFSYQSAFTNYRPFADEGEMSDKTWRTANDEMERLGGHAGHVKDATASADSPSSEISSANEDEDESEDEDENRDDGINSAGKGK
jgi:hypothetical protein